MNSVLYTVNNWLNEYAHCRNEYAHGSQDFIRKFYQAVSEFKNNQKLSKGSEIIFILMNLTTKIYLSKDINSIFQFNTNKD